MDRFEGISAAERQFAKEVALNVIYLQPPKMWQNLIPGMFFLDFLRRGRIIRRYTKKYMFPRMLALEAVRQMANGASEQTASRHAREFIEAELQPFGNQAPVLARAYQQAVDLLAGHYHRLLRAHGEGYGELVHAAYRSAGEYKTYLDQLTAAEKQIDNVIIEATGSDKPLASQLQLEANQVAERRRKELERIFGPAA